MSNSYLTALLQLLTILLELLIRNYSVTWEKDYSSIVWHDYFSYITSSMLNMLVTTFKYLI